MWAEWMQNFDLSVTKDDIEKYEKRRRKNNMDDTIQNLKICIKKAKEALKQKEDIGAEFNSMGEAKWGIVCGNVKLEIHIERLTYEGSDVQ